jgi:hypothetical protein
MHQGKPLEYAREVTRPMPALQRSRRVGVRERTASGRAFCAVLLRKIFEDLNPDFLRDRAFNPAHAIPEPDDFALFFDVHESTSREWVE